MHIEMPELTALSDNEERDVFSESTLFVTYPAFLDIGTGSSIIIDLLQMLENMTSRKHTYIILTSVNPTFI